MHIENGWVVIDSYPLRRWFVKGTTELPGYNVLLRYLVAEYKVCYHCQIPVKMYPQVDGEPTKPDRATIDHLNSRRARKRHELTIKVLSCFKCNQERNNQEQRRFNK